MATGGVWLCKCLLLAESTRNMLISEARGQVCYGSSIVISFIYLTIQGLRGDTGVFHRAQCLGRVFLRLEMVTQEADTQRSPVLCVGLYGEYDLRASGVKYNTRRSRHRASCCICTKYLCVPPPPFPPSLRIRLF